MSVGFAVSADLKPRPMGEVAARADGEGLCPYRVKIKLAVSAYLKPPLCKGRWLGNSI